jgi:aspartate racemase
MKTIGLIGGMSWESTLEYYRIINQEIRLRLGGLHSAKILMYSVDFAEIEPLMRQGRWDEIGARIVGIAKILEHAGADLLLLCTNTVHKIAGWIEEATTIPFIHIADAAGEEIANKGLKKVGLLGTSYTMEENFLKARLSDKYALTTLIPSPSDRPLVNDIIFGELCHGIINESSRTQFLRIMERLIADGAEGIILGCTEIPLLVKPEESAVPLFDTTLIHALRAVSYAING